MRYLLSVFFVLLSLPAHAGGLSITKLPLTSPVSGDFTWLGDIIFGSSAGAANAISFQITDGCIEFEGATANTFETSVCSVDPTADATFSWPALAAGTYTPAVLETAQTFTQLNIFSQATPGNEVVRFTTIAANDDIVEKTYQNLVTTTNNTATVIHTIPIPASTTVLLRGFIVARRTGGSAGTTDDGAAYEFQAAYNNLAGTATAIGSPSLTVIGENQAGWTVDTAVSSANLSLRVTGATNNNVTWHLTLFYHEVGS
jgi:hypothetical protein